MRTNAPRWKRGCKPAACRCLLPSEELRRLRTEIHQIGNNINQLARKANAGFASRDEVTRALRMLDRVYELMYGFSK